MAAANPTADTAQKKSKTDDTARKKSSTDDAAPKKSKKVLLIAIVAAVVVLAAGGGAAWYFMRAHDDGAETPKGDVKAGAKAGAKGADKAAKVKERKPPVFLPLDSFTVNLQGAPGRENFLQVGLVLEMADGPASDAVKQQMPVIRSQVLLLLAGKTAEELGKPDGKAALAAEILARVRKPQPSTPPLAGVEAVHYAAFIIQ